MSAWLRAISNSFVITICVVAEFFINCAGATILPIPGDRPVATVDIPPSWNPITAKHGVDGIALEGAVHLAVEFIPAADPAAAGAIATKRLRERGVVVTPATKRVGARNFSGFEALKIDFDGVDSSGDSNITLILIAIPAKSGFITLAYWGDDEAQESVSNDIQSIADSVVVTK